MTASPAGSPVEQLRRLRSAGRLAADWPRVRTLLAELADTGDREGPGVLADWLACGRILAGLDTDQVLARHPAADPVTVAITGHATLAELTDPLVAELARHGMPARIVTGDHGAWQRDLTDADGHFALAEPDMTLCVLDAGAVFGEVGVPWSATDAADACERLAGRLQAVCAATAKRGGILVLNTLPLLRTHTHQLVDERQRSELAAMWREFNARLLRLSVRHPHVVVIDLDPLIADAGPATDPRLAQYTRAPFTVEVLAGYAREAGHILRSRRGLTRKCLVLDLDGTLWAGVLGDDGPEGVDADPAGLRGAPHDALQKVVKQLAAQGVLLAVSSKNDVGPVLEALRGRRDMTLGEADFVRVHADWQPKDNHLTGLAEDLGIATDSLVFADDSAAERALIRGRLPDVAVVPLNGEPALHVPRLLRDGWFTVPRLTAEDAGRSGDYRGTAARGELRRRVGSHEEYLRDLRIQVRVAPPEPREYARIAQLSLRSNQFNLTGERLSEARVAGLVADPSAWLLAVHVEDRFGDSGLTGAVLARHAPDGLRLEMLLLSCRVLARGIEQGVVAGLLAAAAARGLPAVHARYRATPKNGRARALYPGLGFTVRARSGGEELFTRDLSAPPAVPAHLTLDLRLDDIHGAAGAHSGEAEVELSRQ
ncbi:HAD-IIIC family phosphatase [Streptomyces boninensis]|uniref:HAD-IIIC family phosphatase n=1 Tax=Streptomyces boninensis TaxID=2039455 RepID=UPI003B21C1D2